MATSSPDIGDGGYPIFGSACQQEQEDSEVTFRKNFAEEMIAWDTSSDISRLEQFLLTEHPLYAWQNTYQSAALVPGESHATIMADELIDMFPDILQRKLLEDAYHWLASAEGRSGPIDCGFGILHRAVIFGQMKIVELLTDCTQFREKVKKRLLERAATENGDGFEAIQRAMLWSHFEEMSQTNHVRPMAHFMTKFQMARVSESSQNLDTLINEATKVDSYLWQIVLLWASKSRSEIVKMFKEKQQDLFESILAEVENPQFANVLTQAVSGEVSNHHDHWLEEIVTLVTQRSRLSESTETTYKGLLKSIIHGRTSPSSFGPFDYRFNCERTALHLAAANGDEKMVALLMKSYDKFSAQEWLEFEFGDFSDAYWMTPLHYAVLGNQEKVIEKFIHWKLFEAHVSDFNYFLRTALHMACGKEGKKSTIRALMKIPKIDVTAKDCCEYNLLHCAVDQSPLDVIQFLLSQSQVGHMGRWIDLQLFEKVREQGKQTGRDVFDIAIKNGKFKLFASIPKMKSNLDTFYSEVDALYRDRQCYVDAANAMLVGAALIASVTFGGWLQPPGGDGGHQSNSTLRIFWAFNSLSFFFSVATVMAGAGAVVPTTTAKGLWKVGNSVRSIKRWLSVASFILAASIIFVLAAFSAAGFVAISSIPHLRDIMIATTSIGVTMCATIGLFFLMRLFRIRANWVRVDLMTRLRQTRTSVHINVANLLFALIAALMSAPIDKERDFFNELHMAIFLSQMKIIHDFLRKELGQSQGHNDSLGVRRRKQRDLWKHNKGVHGRRRHIKLSKQFSCREYAGEKNKLLLEGLLREITQFREGSVGCELKEYRDMWKAITQSYRNNFTKNVNSHEPHLSTI